MPCSATAQLCGQDEWLKDGKSMPGFDASSFIGIPRKYLTLACKEKPLPTQPHPNDIPSLHTTEYIKAYSGPENAGNPEGTREFFSEIRKYLGFKSDLESASHCCIVPKRPLKTLLYIQLEKLCTEKKNTVQNEIRSVKSNKLKQTKKKVS